MSAKAKPLLNLECDTLLEVKGVNTREVKETVERVGQSGSKAELRVKDWEEKTTAGLKTVSLRINSDRIPANAIIAKAKDEPVEHTMSISSEVSPNVDVSGETFVGKMVYSSILLEVHAGDGKDHVKNVLSKARNRQGAVERWNETKGVYLINTDKDELSVKALKKLRDWLDRNLFQFNKMVVYSEAAEA